MRRRSGSPGPALPVSERPGTVQHTLPGAAVRNGAVQTGSAALVASNVRGGEARIPPDQRRMPLDAMQPLVRQVGGFGPLFQELRQVLGLSVPDVAAKLRCPVDVIFALEAGDVSRLPPWPHAARIVSLYTGLAGIDPRPVLELMHREIAHREIATRHDFRGGDVRRQLAGETFDETSAPHAVLPDVRRYFGRAGSWLVTAAAKLPLDGRRLSAAGAILLVLVGAYAQASTLQASLATLEPPIMGLMRGAQDYLLSRAAPVRDGLRWIEVDDPRERRADKLPVARPRPF